MLALAAPAQAAAMTITHDPDPTEERGVRVTVSGTAPADSALYVTYRPAGGQQCAPTYATEDAIANDLMYGRDVSGTYAETETLTVADPGQVLICAYLQGSSSDTQPRDQASLVLPVRSATATLGLSFPASVRPGQSFVAGANGTAEFARGLYVTIRPAGAPCGPAYSIEDQHANDLLYGQSVQGTFAQSMTVDGLNAGTYLACGYVQEGSGDLAPEAVASAVVQAAMPPAPLSLSTTAKRQRLTTARTRGVGVRVRGNGATKLYVTLARSVARRLKIKGPSVSGRVVLGSATTTATPTGTSVRLTLSRSAASSLRKRTARRMAALYVQVEARAGAQRAHVNVHLTH